MNQKTVRGQTFDELYRKHHDAVFRACLRFAAGDRDWAMDRTHDVFVTLAREVDALRDASDLGGWLYRVAVNTCLMDLRRAKGWRRIKVRDQVAWLRIASRAAATRPGHASCAATRLLSKPRSGIFR